MMDMKRIAVVATLAVSLTCAAHARVPHDALVCFGGTLSKIPPSGKTPIRVCVLSARTDAYAVRVAADGFSGVSVQFASCVLTSDPAQQGAPCAL